jgi:hypothetical protein
MNTARSLTRVITQGVRQEIQLSSKRTNYPYNYRHAITPPRNRIPFAEKVFWGVFMTGVIVSVPAWVLIHHREYMGATDEE